MKKLKTIKIYFADVYNEQLHNERLGSIRTYNEDGETIRLDTFSDDGKLITSQERIYKDKQLKELVVKDLDMNSVQRTEYKYDGKLPIEEIEYFENGTLIKNTVDHDDQGRVTSMVQTDESNAFLGKTEIEYNNQKKSEKKFDEENVLYEESSIDYNLDGDELKIDKIEYYPDDNMEENRRIQTITNKYYDGKNKIEEQRERYGKVIYQEKNEFDSNNNLISSTIHNIESKNPLKGKYEYNSLNLLISEIHFNGEVAVYSKTIEYDDEKNPIAITEEKLGRDNHVIRSRYTLENEYVEQKEID